MGTISGTLSKYPDAVVVWVDAHADINTVTSTPSGNIHGMPVAFLMGLPTTETIPEFSWIKPGILKPHQIVYIGLRDVDVGEKRILKENGIKAFSMHEVDKFGIGKVVQMALDHVNPHRDRPIHLSFDVDALDPSVAPSTGTPVSIDVYSDYLAIITLAGPWRADLPGRSLYLRSRSRDRSASWIRLSRSESITSRCSGCSSNSVCGLLSSP